MLIDITSFQPTILYRKSSTLSSSPTNPSLLLKGLLSIPNDMNNTPLNLNEQHIIPTTTITTATTTAATTTTTSSSSSSTTLPIPIIESKNQPQSPTSITKKTFSPESKNSRNNNNNNNNSSKKAKKRPSPPPLSLPAPTITITNLATTITTTTTPISDTSSNRVNTPPPTIVPLQTQLSSSSTTTPTMTMTIPTLTKSKSNSSKANSFYAGSDFMNSPDPLSIPIPNFDDADDFFIPSNSSMNSYSSLMEDKTSALRRILQVK